MTAPPAAAAARARAVALDHYRDRAGLAEAAEQATEQAWREVDPAAVDASWLALLPQLQLVVAGAQLAAAGAADAYLDTVLAEQDLPTAAQGPVAAAALAGVASDGRPLASLMFRPAVTALAALAGGVPTELALAAGLVTAQMITRTQVADAGRVADAVALTARRAVSGYVRMVVGRSCPRCAILAGRRYRWSAGFRRHPRCDCIHIPAAESTAGDLTVDPARLITSGRVVGLSRAQRTAIDLGADPAQVVNASRGMYLAGGRAFTTESTTARGSAPPVRLMPEQILLEAADRDDAIRLLRLHAYIV